MTQQDERAQGVPSTNASTGAVAETASGQEVPAAAAPIESASASTACQTSDSRTAYIITAVALGVIMALTAATSYLVYLGAAAYDSGAYEFSNRQDGVLGDPYGDSWGDGQDGQNGQGWGNGDGTDLEDMFEQWEQRGANRA